MKIIIVDFDHTISNTRRFAQEIIDLCHLQDKQEYHDMIEQLHTTPEVQQVRLQLPEFRFDGVTDFLQDMPRYFDYKVLLTKCNYYLPWQKRNIQYADLDQYFEETIVTTDQKIAIIKQIITQYPDGEITFVNDIYSHQPENDVIAQTYPEVQVVSIDNYTAGGYTIQQFHKSLQT